MVGASWGYRVLAVSGGLLLSGCTEPVTLRPPVVEVSDSAGVRFVRIPPLGEFTVPDWSLRLQYSTSNVGGEEIELFRVADALFVSDSSLVLANSGSSELVIIAPGGDGYRRVGREGDGPGEFRRLLRLLPAQSNGFFAFDWRLSLFDDEGRFVETRRLDPANQVVSILPLAVFADGRSVSVLGDQRIFQRDGSRRDTVPLLVFAPGSPRPDTIGTWLGRERAFAELAIGSLLVPIGFARTAFHATNGFQFAIGSTDSLDLTVFSPELEPSLRIVAPPPSDVPSDSDKDRWLELLSGDLPVDRPEVERAFANAPVRDRFPGFDGLMLDSEGRIWVGDYLRPGEDERRWVIFSPSGVPQAQIHIPAAGFARLPGRTELLAVGGDRIALLRKTRLDEEYVEVWTFLPAP